jgi:Protein of unknown function (DUF1176)
MPATSLSPLRVLAFSFLFSASIGGAIAQTAPAPAPAPVLPRIALELFEKSTIDRTRGCSFALWQDDREPERDKFAIAFIENLGRNDVRENARIKVGGEVLTFKRIAVGGAQEYGNKTFPNALYKADKDDSYLIFDLKLDTGPGEVLEVKSGTMTVVRPRFVPFTASVKGDIACGDAPPAPRQAAAPAARPASPAPAVVAPPAAAPQQQAARTPPLEVPKLFERYEVRPNDIPANMRAEAVKFGCNANALRRAPIGYSLSEESALWELNCSEYAPKVPSKIYALVYTLDPKAQYTFQIFDIPKGKNHQGSPQELLAPQWDMRTKIVSSTYTEGNGSDCGTFQRHQLTADGSFVMIEYREKSICDGKSMKPSEFPLVYRR